MIPSTEDLITLSENGNAGLRPEKWRKTLEQIRDLPETYERTYPWAMEPGEEE